MPGAVFRDYNLPTYAIALFHSYFAQHHHKAATKYTVTFVLETLLQASVKAITQALVS